MNLSTAALTSAWKSHQCDLLVAQVNGASPALVEDLAILAPGPLPLVSYQTSEEH